MNKDDKAYKESRKDIEYLISSAHADLSLAKARIKYRNEGNYMLVDPVFYAAILEHGLRSLWVDLETMSIIDNMKK